MGKKTKINKQSVIMFWPNWRQYGSLAVFTIKIKKKKFYFILPIISMTIQKDLNLTINKVKYSGTQKLFGQSANHKKEGKKW